MPIFVLDIKRKWPTDRQGPAPLSHMRQDEAKLFHEAMMRGHLSRKSPTESLDKLLRCTNSYYLSIVTSSIAFCLIGVMMSPLDGWERYPENIEGPSYQGYCDLAEYNAQLASESSRLFVSANDNISVKIIECNAQCAALDHHPVLFTR